MAFDRYGKFDVDQGMLDIADLIHDLKARPECNGKVGVLGFCFGGRYAFLAAAQLPIDVGVSFHGTLIGQHLDQCVRVACPLSLHFGEEDNQAPMEEVERISSAASGNPNIEIFRYPNAKHGFMQHDRPSHLPAAAELAFARGLDVLASRLKAREQVPAGER